MKQFMIEFDLPAEMSSDFISKIPEQRYVVNKMLAEGKIHSYAVSLDRRKLWVILVSPNEFEVMDTIAEFPLIDYMTPHITELMFHNMATMMHAISLN